MSLHAPKPPYGRAHDRKARRQAEAKTRNEAYNKLSLDEKINQQSAHCGKQFIKLMKLKYKQS